MVRNQAIVTLLMWSLVSPFSWAFADSGDDPYTPSKREWLMLWIKTNAQNYQHDSGGRFYITVDHRDKDLIAVGVMTGNDKKKADQYCHTLVNEAKNYARDKKWSWLKIKCVNP